MPSICFFGEAPHRALGLSIAYVGWEEFFTERKAAGEAEHPEGKSHADNLAFVGFLNPEAV